MSAGDAQGEVYIHTYSFSGETEVASDLGFEYAVLPQVGVRAICCLCNLRGKKKREREKNMQEVG